MKDNSASFKKKYLPKISIVIVTWNKKDSVLKLLSQLSSLYYPSKKLTTIVVDNHSQDNTVQAIETSFPEVILIKNDQNLGGAGGFNTGMRWVIENHATCEFIWLLDNDVEIENDTLITLVEALNSQPNAAICGSKIMDIDNRKDIIEVGALIDYTWGGIKRYIPDNHLLSNKNAIFNIDYVAACSLLVRTHLVKKYGIWHEKLFIYWDDMEWCTRFKALGFNIIASNASIVYHPTWNERILDNSAIWRNYYRSRNSLWFFNQYTTGVKRRFLLMILIIKIMRASALSCISANESLSMAFINGIEDFFTGRYGKRLHTFQVININEYFYKNQNKNICIFIPDKEKSKKAKKYISCLQNKIEDLKITAIIPDGECSDWENILKRNTIRSFRLTKNNRISFSQWLKILNYFRLVPWDILLTDYCAPKIGTIWHRDVVRIDFNNSECIAIEKINYRLLFGIPQKTLSYLKKVITHVPEKEHFDLIDR